MVVDLVCRTSKNKELSILNFVDKKTDVLIGTHSILNNKSLLSSCSLFIVDEDVSSGATAYILDKIMVDQNAFFHLDSAPVTLSAKDHRPAYGSDGDYFSKPNVDDIIEEVYAVMHESNPSKFPKLY